MLHLSKCCICAQAARWIDMHFGRLQSVLWARESERGLQRGQRDPVDLGEDRFHFFKEASSVVPLHDFYSALPDTKHTHFRRTPTPTAKAALGLLPSRLYTHTFCLEFLVLKNIRCSGEADPNVAKERDREQHLYYGAGESCRLRTRDRKFKRRCDGCGRTLRDICMFGWKFRRQYA